MNRIRNACSLLLLGLAGCVPGRETDAAAVETEEALQANETTATLALRDCRVLEAAVPLPDEVRESSGLALSRRDSGLFWTHNDAGNGAEIFAVNERGRLVQRVRIANAQAEDWEDIESSMCDDGACLFVADIGDNNGKRDLVTIYRIPEPQTTQTVSAPAVALRTRYPDGPQDAESLFATAAGDLYVVTKGQDGPITLYRYPSPQRPDETLTLERVGELLPERARPAIGSPAPRRARTVDG